ncbi:MAG: hypothetical protein ACLS37_13840, partial [Alistipes sp.]
MLARAACSSFLRRVRCRSMLRFTESSAWRRCSSWLRSSATAVESVAICSMRCSRMEATPRRLAILRATCPKSSDEK